MEPETDLPCLDDETSWSQFAIPARREALSGADGQSARVSRSSAASAPAQPAFVVRMTQPPKRPRSTAISEASQAMLEKQRQRRICASKSSRDCALSAVANGDSNVGKGGEKLVPVADVPESSDKRNDVEDAEGDAEMLDVQDVDEDEAGIRNVNSGSSSTTLTTSLSSDSLGVDELFEDDDMEVYGLLLPYKSFSFSYRQPRLPSRLR
jgi:hypothetical protein